MILLPLLLLVFSTEPEPIDMGDDFLMRPGKTISDKARLYILDIKLHEIFVCDSKKVLFTFGSAGQGPGDMMHPVSISFGPEGIYLLEKLTGRVTVFSKEGQFIRTLKLDDTTENLTYVSDLVLIDDQIYVIYDHGLALIRTFTLQGVPVAVLYKKEETFPPALMHLYNAIFDADQKLLYVHSRFDGTLFYIKPGLKPRIQERLTIHSSATEESVAKIKDDQKHREANDRISAQLFLPLVNNGQGHIYSIVAGAVRPGRYQAMPFRSDGDLAKMAHYKTIMLNLKKIPEGVFAIAPLGDKMAYINYEGQIYLYRSF